MGFRPSSSCRICRWTGNSPQPSLRRPVRASFLSLGRIEPSAPACGLPPPAIHRPIFAGRSDLGLSRPPPPPSAAFRDRPGYARMREHAGRGSGSVEDFSASRGVGMEGATSQRSPDGPPPRGLRARGGQRSGRTRRGARLHVACRAGRRRKPRRPEIEGPRRRLEDRLQ